MSRIICKNLVKYEIVADVAIKVNNNYSQMLRLIDTNPKFAKQLADKVIDVYQRVFKPYEQNNNALVGEGADFKKAAEMWAQAAKEKGVNTQADDTDSEVMYSIDYEFVRNYDSWASSGRPDRKTLTVGTTSQALQSIGVKDQNITWDTSKINRILKEHKNIDDSILCQVPNVLEEPIIIMQSLQKESRVVVLGELMDLNNKPILVVLELTPKNHTNNIILDEIKIVSAYGKDSTQSLINRSDILYINPNKNRTNSWLELNRLQLPLSITNYGSIKSVTYPEGNVNTYYANNSENDSDKAYSMDYATDVDENTKADDVRTVASNLILNYGADVLSNRDVSNKLRSIRDKMRLGINGNKDEYEAAVDEAYSLARELLENGTAYGDVYLNDEVIDARKYLRNTPIRIPESVKKSFPTLGYDSFNQFRKSNMGSLRIANDGVELDSIYQQLSSTYPTLFNSEAITEEAQIEQILDFIETSNPTRDKDNLPFVEEDVREAAMEILDEFGRNESDGALPASWHYFSDDDKQAWEDAADDEESRKKISKFYENSIMGKETFKDIQSVAEARIPEFMYDGISNKETYEFAQSSIEIQGVERATTKLLAKAASDKAWTADDTAMALALMSHYQTNDDPYTAVDIASALRGKLTQAGQMVQAAAIVNKLTPEGKFIELQRQAEEINAKAEKTIRKKEKGETKKHRQMIIDEYEAAVEKDKKNEAERLRKRKEQLEGGTEDSGVKDITKVLKKPLTEEERAILKDVGISEADFYNHTPQMQKTILEYGNSVDQKIINFKNALKNNPTNKYHHKIADVSQREIEDIKRITGRDATGYKHTIDKDALKHIEKHHGKNGIRDNTMSNFNDVARIKYVIENYDSIDISGVKDNKFKNSNNTESERLIYTKSIDGTYFVIEAFPDSNNKELHVVTAYKNKKKASEETDNVNNIPGPTSKNAPSAYAFDNSVPQKSDTVKPEDKKRTSSKTRNITDVIHKPGEKNNHQEFELKDGSEVPEAGEQGSLFGYKLHIHPIWHYVK